MNPKNPSVPPVGRTLDSRLDESLDESFPASDPPAVFGDTPEERNEPEEDD